MISNIAKEFINLAISKLELEKPTQEKINEATNYLKDAISQIKKEKEPREYKVWLFNALYDTNYVENEFASATSGEFLSQNTYKRTEYIEIPLGLKELFLTPKKFTLLEFQSKPNLKFQMKKFLLHLKEAKNLQR